MAKNKIIKKNRQKFMKIEYIPGFLEARGFYEGGLGFFLEKVGRLTLKKDKE